MIDLIVPTIKGREESLERTLASYEGVNQIVISDSPTCGQGWIEGIKRSKAPYLAFTSDDIEVANPDWIAACIEAVEEGKIPCPVIRAPDGELESCGGDMGLPHCLNRTMLEDWAPVDYTTVPFLSREQVERIGMLPTHYCSDVWVSYRGRQLGYETVIRTAYELVHHQEQVGRGAGMTQFERSERDRVKLERALCAA